MHTWYSMTSKSQVTCVETYISHLKRDFILVMCSHDGTSNRNFAVRKFSKFSNFTNLCQFQLHFPPISGPAVSDPDTVWFLRSFFHFFKRSGNPILRLFNNFKLFWILKILKSNLEILIFQSMFLSCDDPNV